MVRKFGAPPFSVLETRQGYWQDRKKFWLDLGIESEQGRDGGLLGGFADMAERAGTKSNGTSVFDPFLCELMYDWFNVDGGTVIDPFAGGSVRGIVAARTGHPYTGLELRGEQVDANKKQAEDILTPDDEPADWITGDSDKTLDTFKGEYDMIFSCPPYADLEVYSDDPADLSNMSYDQFKNAYRRIINKAVLHLKEDRFAVFVVGEVRDNKRGGGVSRIRPRHHRRVCGRGVRVLQRNHIGQFGINRGNAGVPPIQCVAQGLQGPPKRAGILQRESKKYQKQFSGVCGRGKRG